MPQQTNLSETRLQDVLLQITDSIDDGVVGFDSRCRYVFWNRTMEKLTGLLAGEVIGRGVFEVFPSLLKLGHDKWFKEALAGRTVVSSQLPFMLAPDREAWLEATYYPFKEWGKVAGGIAIVRDISQRQHAGASAAELNLVQQRFQQIFEGQFLAVQVFATNGTLLRLNNGHEELFGLGMQELAGYNVFQDPGALSEGLAECVRSAIESGRADVPELQFLPQKGRLAGQCVWTRAFTYPVVESGMVREIVVCHVDITRQKQAQAELAASEGRLARAHKLSRIAAYEYDVQSGTLTWRHELPALKGLFQAGELRSWLRHLAPGDRDRASTTAQQLLDGEEVTAEFCIEGPDGERTTVLCSGELVASEQGRASRIVGVVQDITDVRSTEATLRRDAERFTALANAAPQILWTTNARGVPTFFNERWYCYVGLQEGADQLWSWTDFVHADDRNFLAEERERAILTGSSYSAEVRFKRGHDGIYRWHLLRCVPVLDSAGRTVQWSGAATDLHELKSAQEELRLGREQLRMAQQAGRIGTWELSFETNELSFGSEFAEVLGLIGPGSISFDHLLSLMPFTPDRTATEKALKSARRSKRDFQLEFRTKSVGEDIRRILMRGQMVQVRGKATLVGIALDISSRHHDQLSTAPLAIEPEKESGKPKVAQKAFRAAAG